MPNIENYTYKEEKRLNKEFDITQIYMAKVMDTSSIGEDGSIMVWVLNTGNPTDDKEYWVKAYYCSAFYGTSAYDPTTTNNSLSSFGMWLPMPYVGNYVFIFYPRIHGGNVRPYWFGCPMDEKYNSIIPGYTINNKLLNDILKTQGLSEDKLRGSSYSSSHRGNPSMCYGFTSPLGHQMIIDDGWSEKDKEKNKSFTRDKDILKKVGNTSKFYDAIEWKNNLNDTSAERRYDSGFRFRTRNGAEVIISDCGDIYAINCDGTAWAEITPYGEINGWAEKGVNIASEGDINLHSTKNINIDCNGKISMRAKDSISIETSELNMKASQSQMNSSIVCNDIQAKSGNIGSLTSQSAQIVGTFSGTLDGTSTYATSSGKVAIHQPKPNVKNPEVTINSTTEENEIETQNNSSKIKSICTQVPTHEPWVGHNYNDKIKTPTIKG